MTKQSRTPRVLWVAWQVSMFFANSMHQLRFWSTCLSQTHPFPVSSYWVLRHGAWAYPRFLLAAIQAKAAGGCCCWDQHLRHTRDTRVPSNLDLSRRAGSDVEVEGMLWDSWSKSSHYLAQWLGPRRGSTAVGQHSVHKEDCTFSGYTEIRI